MRHSMLKVAGKALLLGAALLMAEGCANKQQKQEIGSGNFPLGTSSRMNPGGTSGSTNGIGAPDINQIQYDSAGNPIGVSESSVFTQVGAQIPELPNILFGFDQAELTAESEATAKANAAYLNANTGLFVNLRGHTDDQGTEEYNLSLGQRRAQAVREFLIGEGVAAERLNTVSFGMALPAHTDGSDASRALNRRVEFFVFTEE